MADNELSTLNKNERTKESLDLLLKLLNEHKPHLKPYSSRLNSWIELLHQYNYIAGTHFKQPRTLKKRFERIIDTYRINRSIIKCEDPLLLEKLVDEYNRPYRLIQKRNDETTDVDINDNQIDDTPITPNSSITKATLVQSVSVTDPNSTSKLNKIRKPKRNISPDTHNMNARFKKPIQANSKNNLDMRYRYSLNDMTTPIPLTYETKESSSSNRSSKENSSQPPPLDTINLGMPRRIQLQNENIEESLDSNPDSISTIFYPANNSNQACYLTSNEHEPFSSLFIVDNNNCLVDISKILAHNPEITVDDKAQYNTTNNESFRDPSMANQVNGGNINTDIRILFKNFEKKIQREIQQIMEQNYAFQDTMTSKLDTILSLLSGRKQNISSIPNTDSAFEASVQNKK